LGIRGLRLRARLSANAMIEVDTHSEGPKPLANRELHTIPDWLAP
jgi:hypothetical protein